ncbi:peptide deformylase [Kutzneria viridogrisea]|uniref:Peptide deformylase n=1 Tax=Kutzneria viridogrisea TaxID=47990 RepID=A0ABR6BP17_9PSEU|nr:peptide deformylase [Kutzneria viridogrisea]
MTAQPIRLLGDPVLRSRATEVVDFDKEFHGLVRDMWDTMEATGGAGLAAPQIGVDLRVFTYHCDGHAGHLVNPVVEVLGEGYQDGPEGCLSIPGVSVDCRRHLEVVATGWNMYGEPIEVTGDHLLARCVQHEVDHLDGVLYVDRLEPRAREFALRAAGGER